MSRSRFDAVFRGAMGISFGRFELNHRLHAAARQLVSSADPIKAIARRFGFVDASHFHRRFVAHFAQTPAAYRAARLSVGAKADKPLSDTR